MSVQALFARIDQEQQQDDTDFYDDIEVITEPVDATNTDDVIKQNDATQPAAKYTPAIVGKDADLMRVNTETGAIEPRDDVARATIAGLGRDLDAYMVIPGAHYASQLSLNADGGNVQIAPGGKRMGLAPSNDNKLSFDNFSLVKPASDDERKQRMSENWRQAHQESEQEQVREEGGRRATEEEAARARLQEALSAAGEADAPDETQAQQPTPNPQLQGPSRREELLSQFGPGGAVAMGLIGGIVDGTLMAADKTVRTAGRLTSDGVKGAITTCQEVVDQLRNRSEHLNTVSSKNQEKIVDLNRRSGPSLADLDDAGEVSSIIGKVANKEEIGDRVRDLAANDQNNVDWLDNLRGEFGKAFNSQLDIVHKAMNLDDIHAPSNPEEFEAALGAMPEDRQKVVSNALDTMRKNCERLGGQLTDWLGDKKDNKFSSLSTEEQAKAADTIADWVDDPSKLADKKYKELVDNLGTEGKTFKSQIGDLFGGVRSMLSNVMDKLRALVGAQNQAHEIHEQKTADSGSRLG